LESRPGGLGGFAEAIAKFRQAIKLNPKYPNAYNALGNALKWQGKVDDAIAAYRQAIKVNGKAYVYVNLGSALEKQGKIADAIVAYQRAIKLNTKEALANVAADALARLREHHETEGQGGTAQKPPSSSPVPP
jgi:superkiller protein 3